MTAKAKLDQNSLLAEIENALALGQWLHSEQVNEFLAGLFLVKKQLDGLVRCGESARAVLLYEVFLAGCEEKMKDTKEGFEIKTFFIDLFFAWIHARQEAGCVAEDTVCYMLKMMDQDDYGLCYGIEKDIGQRLKGPVFDMFVKAVQLRFKEALATEQKKPLSIYEYSRPVSHNAGILTTLFLARKNLEGYLDVCRQIGFTPMDCESVAGILKSRRRFNEALDFVERGLSLERLRDWPNYSARNLVALKCDLLMRLDRPVEALLAAWDDFSRHPGEFYYSELMKYVPATDKAQWHLRALERSRESDLEHFIDICLVTGELDRLAIEIEQVDPAKLNDIFYDRNCRAAGQLSANHPLAAIRIYRILALQILETGKSTRYSYAIDYLKKVRELYQRMNMNGEWTVFAGELSSTYQRKSAFMMKFRDLVSDTVKKEPPSFEMRMRERWEKKVAD